MVENDTHGLFIFLRELGMVAVGCHSQSLGTFDVVTPPLYCLLSLYLLTSVSLYEWEGGQKIKQAYHTSVPYEASLYLWRCAKIFWPFWRFYSHTHLGPNYCFQGFYRALPKSSTMCSIRDLYVPSTFVHMIESLTVFMPTPGSAFIKPDQLDPWIKDQLGSALLPQFRPCSYEILCHVGGTSPPTWHKIW